MPVNQRITAPSTVRESRGATITQDRAAGVVSGVRSAPATVTNPASRNETPQYQNNIRNPKRKIETEENVMMQNPNQVRSRLQEKVLVAPDENNAAKPKLCFTIQEDYTGLAKCSNTSCITCRYVNQDHIIKCSITNKQFVTVKPEINCKTKNVVYLITCRKCQKQYVGETGRCLKDRIREHVYNIKQNSANNNSCIVRHFNSQYHSHEDVQVQIVEVLEEAENKDIRLQKEAFWIQLLNTAYPLGLNSNVQENGKSVILNKNNIDTNKLYNVNPFFNIKCPRRYRNRGKKKKRSEKKLTIEKYDAVKSYFLKHEYNNLFQTLRSMNYKTKKNLWSRVATITDDEELKFILLAYLLNCLKPRDNRPKSNVKKDTVIVPFSHPIIEKLYLQGIFRDINIRNVLNKYNANAVQVAFTYNTPVSALILNHAKIINSNSLEDLIRLANEHCDCQHSPFNNVPHNHVITGDLRIIKDDVTREIMEKGSKFRTSQPIDVEKLENIIMELSNNYVKKMQRKYKVNDDDCKLIRDRIEFRTKKHLVRLTNMLPDYRKRNKPRLNSEFVYAPADKAANNIVVICKPYYVQVILNELGISPTSNTWGNATYEYLPGKQPDDIIRKHINYLNSFSLTISDEDKKLPTIYALPKLHKNPSKWRIIAAAKHSSLKSLNILAMKILTFFKTHFHNYCLKIEERTNTQVYCSINNSAEVNTWIMANKKDLNSIYTADFSTLYTTLPHTLIKTAIFKLIRLCFKNTGNQKLLVNTRSYIRKPCRYNNNDSTDAQILSLRLEDVLTIIEHVIDENFVNVGGHVFRQKCGIPMGGNSSPLLADLCLSWNEFAYLNTRNNVRPLKIFRYIDDILVMNTNNFSDIMKDMYGMELKLERTNTTTYECQYLDLNVNIGIDTRVTIYDKTRDFSFPVIKFPHSSSCVHPNLIYNCFHAHLIRSVRICNMLDDLIFNIKLVYDELGKKGAMKTRLDITFLRFCSQYASTLAKYGLTDRPTVLSLLYKRVIN